MKKKNIIISFIFHVFFFSHMIEPAAEIKKECFPLKENCKYQIKIYFYVQRDIVSGLCYEHKVYKKGIPGK